MYRVVIVEDDPMVSLINRTYVERDSRFQVVQTFQDGQTALDWLAQNPVDLVVLDVYMPLFTGEELLRALRHQQIDVDAIMVTAANAGPTVDALLKMGVVDYLMKPFTAERWTLSAAIERRWQGTWWNKAHWISSSLPPVPATGNPLRVSRKVR